MESRFECRPGSRQFLTPTNTIDYTGLTLSMTVEGGVVSYFMDQRSEIVKILEEFGMEGESLKPSPSPPVDVLTSDESLLSSDEAAVCRRMVGKLHFYARGTRWDISPNSWFDESAATFVWLLVWHSVFQIGGARPETKDVFHFYSDSDHHGDKKMSSKNQTVVVILLNGIPVHWRSNRQPITADSPAASEIYALKDSVRDGRLALLLWVAEKLCLHAQWPFVVQVDSN